MKSTQVVLDYLEVDPLSPEKVVVVPNKVTDSKDVQFIVGRLGPVKYTGPIAYSSALRDFEQDGDRQHFLSFVIANVNVLSSVDEALLAVERDWIGMQNRLRVVHQKNCQTWYNSYYGVALDVGLDQPFAPT